MQARIGIASGVNGRIGAIAVRHADKDIGAVAVFHKVHAMEKLTSEERAAVV